MQATLAISERGSTVVSTVAGFASLRARTDQVATLRKNPGLPADHPLAAGFLKNADEQTVASLAAVGRAMHTMGRPTASYRAWGVVAAPNLFGRLGTLQSLLDFRKEGAWGISPHMIPHHSLHAASGTISQALRIQGPNFGISGGPHAVAEAFLVAATLLSDNVLPGLWVVMSGHDPEYLPGAANVDHRGPTTCLALAVALEPQMGKGASNYLPGKASNANWPMFSLPAFLATLDADAPAGQWSLPGGAQLCLHTVPR